MASPSVSAVHLPENYDHLTARAKAPLIALLSLASIALGGYVFSLLLELLRLLRDLYTVTQGGGVSLLRLLFGFGLPILAGVGWIAAVVFIVYAYSRYGVRSRWLKQAVHDLPPEGHAGRGRRLRDALQPIPAGHLTGAVPGSRGPRGRAGPLGTGRHVARRFGGRCRRSRRAGRRSRRGTRSGRPRNAVAGTNEIPHGMA